MKLPSVNVVPPNTHMVINDSTLSRALKHSGFCRTGQLLMSKPNTFTDNRYDTTSWNKLDLQKPRGWRTD